MKVAILVVDMLNDFVTGSLKCERGLAIVKPLANLLDQARKNNVPVIFCNDQHDESDHEMKLWGKHAMKGTKGAQIIDDLNYCSKDYVVPKHAYSGFFKTNLYELLTQLGCDSVVITGLHTHMCCRHTAADAYQNGLDVIVASDCTDAFSQQDYESGLKYLKDVYGAKIVTSKQLIEKNFNI